MKNRDYKKFEENGIYHIYNRGVGKMKIFKDDQDFRVFLSRLKENLFPEKKKIENSILKKEVYKRKLLPPKSFDLICYCLMPNHFHLLIQQKTNFPISKIISKVCTSYSMYFNKRYNRVGSLFQDTFKAVFIENNEQLLWTSLYIHENPIKGNLIKNLKNYEWSSFKDYVRLNNTSICKKDILLDQFNSTKSYLKYFENPKKNKEAQNQMIGFLDLFIDEEF